MPKEAKNNNKKVKTSKEKRNFFKDTKAELKKVIWPTSKQLVNNTLAVIAVVLIIGIIVFALDLCFEKINAYGVNKLKSAVQSVETNQEENVEENTETNSETENVEADTEEATTENTVEEVNAQ